MLPCKWIKIRSNSVIAYHFLTSNLFFLPSFFIKAVSTRSVKKTKGRQMILTQRTETNMQSLKTMTIVQLEVKTRALNNVILWTD